MKKICSLLVVSIILLGFIIPAMADSDLAINPDTNAATITKAAANSWTINVPYALWGFDYIDYERSLTETSALNIAAMHMDTNGFMHEIIHVLFGTDLNFNALDICYKYYPGGAQNGFYFGVDAMAARGDGTSVSGEYSQSYSYLAGGSLGFRKIFNSGFTIDVGALAHYNFTETNCDCLFRLNIGYGW